MPNDADASDDLCVTGAWTLEVGGGTGARCALAIAPAEIVAVDRERYDRLPRFDAAQAGWRRGERLRACRADETTVKGALEPGSLRLYAAPDADTPLREGHDYGLDADWGTLGRLPGGAIGEDQPVWASYRFGRGRLDAVVATAQGGVAVRRGAGHVCLPRPPAPAPHERALAHVWISPRLAGLSPDHVFPILETAFPEPPALTEAAARAQLPRAWQTLASGGTLRILAWGDSVTDADYLKECGLFPHQRWQEQFVARLRARFPAASIVLTTAGWGGRATRDFVAAPAGSPYHYATAVLGTKPDLVVSEFVNDAYLTDPLALETAYGRFREDFHRIGAEWIILTPHYVRPDWMGLTGEKEIDDDPRPYVANLRAFAARHGVALADASRRWGRLWRQGLPHTTLLRNAINHPDERGLALYADSLMRLFP